MKALFEGMAARLENGQDVVLASVVSANGSAPGAPGSRMLVDAGGRCAGTVGGGAAEKHAADEAALVLANGRSRILRLTLRQEDGAGDAGNLDMLCGGTLAVFLQFIGGGLQPAAFARRAAGCFSQNRDAWLLYDLAPQGAGNLGLYVRGAAPLLLYPGRGRLALLTEEQAEALAAEAFGRGRKKQVRIVGEEQTAGTAHIKPAGIDGGAVHCEPLVRTGRVVIFGGGHVAQALAPLLGTLGFYTVVYDDRPAYACRELFPTADEVVVGGFGDICANITLNERDCLVVVTRGHAADFEVQRQVLRRPHCYVGVIGSRRKTAAVFARLREAGIPQEALDTVHTPIGLNIGAETPAEIAIAIAAELVSVRTGRGGKAAEW